MRFFVRALSALMMVIGVGPLFVFGAVSAEPTPEETLCLEYINRCRADPMADSLRIAPTGRKSKLFDTAMFGREMIAMDPAPPLVFDLLLIKSARLHSQYQIRNGQGHIEEPGKPGFTGKSPWDRMKAAGFAGFAFAENCYLTAKDPWDSHQGFVIDWGKGGTGGMQKGRGHRKNILGANYSVIGVGAIKHGNGKLAVTHNFSRDKQRRAGGVIYRDHNRNGLYDIGEGVGDVAIGDGGSSVATWKSGAYALPITPDTDRLTVELYGQRYVRRIATGAQNVKFDVAFPSRVELTKIESLVKKLPVKGGTAAQEAARFKQLVEIEYLSRDALILVDQFNETEKLTAEVREKYHAMSNEVRSAVETGDTKIARAVIRKHSKRYVGTSMAPWFRDAFAFVTAKDAYLRLAKVAEAGRTVSPGAVNKQLEKLQTLHSRSTSDEWKTYFSKLKQAYLELTNSTKSS